jgi:Spy/CpxP family protein refolding chaperone
LTEPQTFFQARRKISFQKASNLIAHLNKHHMKTWLLIVLFSGLLTTTLAQPGERRREMERARIEQRQEQDPQQQMAEKLKLTEAQQQQMEEIRLKHHAQMQKIKVELDVKEAELFAATTRDDQKTALKMVDEVSALHKQKLKAQTLHQLEVRSMLDEKQKLLFDEFRYQKKERKKRQHRGS